MVHLLLSFTRHKGLVCLGARSNVSQLGRGASIVLVFNLLLLPHYLFVNAGDAVCELASNTTNCKCADGDNGCSFPKCVDQCVCVGGGCSMKYCLEKCECPKGGCDMHRCIHNCQNGEDKIVQKPVCLTTPSLAAEVRGVGESPEEICKREHSNINATTPYVCTNGLACCTTDIDFIEHPIGMNLGTCRKDYEIKPRRIGGDAMKDARFRHNNIYPKQERSISFILMILGLVLTTTLGAFLFIRRNCWRLMFNDTEHLD